MNISVNIRLLGIVGLILFGSLNPVFAQSSTRINPEQETAPSEQISTPPEQKSSRNLAGTAQLTSISCEAVTITKQPLKHYQNKKLYFCALHIKNESPQSIVVDGDNCRCQFGNFDTRAISASHLLTLDSANLGLSGKAAVGAVTLATAGLAGPIFGEMMTPSQHNGRDPGTSIGVDGVRHRLEVERFGRRLIAAGDETDGWLAFELDDTSATQSLIVPIWAVPLPPVPNYLTVPIKKSAAL